jgi:hypothetical protein
MNLMSRLITNSTLLFRDLSKFAMRYDYCLLIIVVSWIAMLRPYPTVVSINAMRACHPNTRTDSLSCISFQLVGFVRISSSATVLQCLGDLSPDN